MPASRKDKIKDEEVDTILNKVEPTESDVEKLADWAMQVWDDCEKQTALKPGKNESFKLNTFLYVKSKPNDD